MEKELNNELNPIKESRAAAFKYVNKTFTKSELQRKLGAISAQEAFLNKTITFTASVLGGLAGNAGGITVGAGFTTFAGEISSYLTRYKKSQVKAMLNNMAANKISSKTFKCVYSYQGKNKGYVFSRVDI